MKIEEIQPGKKYWKVYTRKQRRSSKKEVQSVAVYVLKLDLSTKRVLASLNGSPPQWFGGTVYQRWKTEDPTSKSIS